jgi:TatD DNase family protein
LLADTHCHLNFESFDTDRPAVVARAQAAGIARILNPGVDLPSSRSAVLVAGAFEPVFAAVGVHPNDAQTWNYASLADLTTLARQPKVVAIGEIGLDYYWDRAPVSLQRAILEQQLDLASELSLPVIIHVRDKSPDDMPAMRDVLSILAGWTSGLKLQNPELAQHPGVLHSFSGDTSAASDANRLNFRIGITGPVTYKKADRLREVAGNIPEDLLLIETDAPFLTPHPHRGERNEPALVRYVAEKIALIRQKNIETIIEITSLNAERLFRW